MDLVSHDLSSTPFFGEYTIIGFNSRNLHQIMIVKLNQTCIVKREAQKGVYKER